MGSNKVSHEPDHEILVLTAYVSSECSDEPLHLLSLARVFSYPTLKVGTKMKTQAKI